MIEEGIKLLEKDWTDEDKVLIQRLLDNLNSYKSFITKSLKQDITSVLKLASNIKDDYDTLKRKMSVIQSIISDEDPNVPKKETNEIEKETNELPVDPIAPEINENCNENVDNSTENKQDQTITESEQKLKNGISKLKFWN